MSAYLPIVPSTATVAAAKAVLIHLPYGGWMDDLGDAADTIQAHVDAEVDAARIHLLTTVAEQDRRNAEVRALAESKLHGEIARLRHAVKVALISSHFSDPQTESLKALANQLRAALTPTTL